MRRCEVDEIHRGIVIITFIIIFNIKIIIIIITTIIITTFIIIIIIIIRIPVAPFNSICEDQLASYDFLVTTIDEMR
jgi:hypothetical protein